MRCENIKHFVTIFIFSLLFSLQSIEVAVCIVTGFVGVVVFYLSNAVSVETLVMINLVLTKRTVLCKTLKNNVDVKCIQ